MNYLLSIFTFVLTLNFCSASVVEQNSETTGSNSDTKELSVQKKEDPGPVFYDDEKRDTAKISAILSKAKEIPELGERVVAITQEFIGTPYVGFTLNLPPEEMLYVNTSGLDCLTFVETVIALAKGADSKTPSLNDYLNNLQSIRYHDGKIDGYPSRLHYISEWSIDNSRRGNFKEITADCDLAQQRVKTINFMTKNRNLYPAMKEVEVYEAIKRNEAPLKDLHYFIIPTSQVDKAAKGFLKSGDIVAIETTKPGLDVSHVGVVKVKNGIPYLIHASSKYKKVVNDTTPLRDYLKRQGSPGIRVFRL